MSERCGMHIGPGVGPCVREKGHDGQCEDFANVAVRMDADADSDLDGIRARLAAATPGPWEVMRNGLGQSCGVITSGGRVLRFGVGGPGDHHGCTHPDAAFVAHAPADIAALLARVDDLETKLAQASDTNESIDEVLTDIAKLTGVDTWDYPWQVVRDVEALKDRAEKAEAEVERLRAQTETQATLIREHEGREAIRVRQMDEVLRDARLDAWRWGGRLRQLARVVIAAVDQLDLERPYPIYVRAALLIASDVLNPSTPGPGAGEEPWRKRAEKAEAEVERLRDDLEFCAVREERNATCAEVRRLRAALEFYADTRPGAGERPSDSEQ